MEVKILDPKPATGKKIKYSELFLSVQGEGRFVGVPSVFFRTFGCNFNCAGFGQPRGQLIPEEEMPHNLDDASKYKSFEELPVVSIGCDSSASWSAKYKHLAPMNTTSEIAEMLLSATTRGTWYDKEQMRETHLVITGGEPMLGWQKAWPELLSMPEMSTLRNITFETNGTRKIDDKFVEDMNKLEDLHVTWSVSPKLSISGHTMDEACVPSTLLKYNAVKNSYLYLKFVVRDEECISEVKKFIKAYKDAGVDIDHVYLMPEGALIDEQQVLTEKTVAKLCMETGYSFSPRLHLNLFGNSWGT